MGGTLDHLIAARAQLEQARTVAEVQEVIRAAEAARVFAKQMRLSMESANLATEIKLLAEIKLADVVDEGQAKGEIPSAGGAPILRNPKNENPLTAAGINFLQVHEARTLRDAYSPAEISQMVAEANSKGKHVARDRLLSEAREARRARERERRISAETERVNDAPASIELRTGDFRDTLADLTDVDAIITDPPYPREYLPLYRDLAKWADQVLRPDGVLVVMSGQTWLPEVIQQMSGYRPYRWTAAAVMPGPTSFAHLRRVNCGWKPLLVYGAPRVAFYDVVHFSEPDKQHHHWGQGLDGFKKIVERFTLPNYLVVDPFLGGGTTAAACALTGRRFIGADIDADSVERSRRRLERLQ